MASKRNGTLYTGVTSDVAARVGQHQVGAVPGFASRYGVNMLVYFEVHDSMEAAIVREKQVKKWRRAWKIAMIEKYNPAWLDLSSSISD